MTASKEGDLSLSSECTVLSSLECPVVIRQETWRFSLLEGQIDHLFQKVMSLQISLGLNLHIATWEMILPCRLLELIKPHPCGQSLPVSSFCRYRLKMLYDANQLLLVFDYQNKCQVIRAPCIWGEHNNWFYNNYLYTAGVRDRLFFPEGREWEGSSIWRSIWKIRVASTPCPSFGQIHPSSKVDL